MIVITRVFLLQKEDKSIKQVSSSKIPGLLNPTLCIKAKMANDSCAEKTTKELLNTSFFFCQS